MTARSGFTERNSECSGPWDRSVQGRVQGRGAECPGVLNRLVAGCWLKEEETYRIPRQNRTLTEPWDYGMPYFCIHCKYS